MYNQSRPPMYPMFHCAICKGEFRLDQNCRHVELPWLGKQQICGGRYSNECAESVRAQRIPRVNRPIDERMLHSLELEGCR